MAIDTTNLTSRRALLTGLTGALFAAVAGTLGRAQPAAAHDPDDIRRGHTNSSINTTTIKNTTDFGYAITAMANGGAGVMGQSFSGTGVYGVSSSGEGAYSQSDTGIAVYGYGRSTTKPAAVGQSFGDNTGVQGYSGLSAYLPAGQAKTGVEGYADTDETSVGVRGTSPTGRGGILKGPVAQLKLIPASGATHPASGDRGDLFVDSSGRLWFCKGSTTWKQLA